MPWLETIPVEERRQFIRDAQSDRFTMSELCSRYGVSRRIGYKWLARYAQSAVSRILTPFRQHEGVNRQSCNASLGGGPVPRHQGTRG